MKVLVFMLMVLSLVDLNGRYYHIRRPSAFFQMVQPTAYRPDPLVLSLFYDGVTKDACQKAINKKQKFVAEQVAKALPQMDVLAVDCVNDELDDIASHAGVQQLPSFVIYKNGKVVSTVLRANAACSRSCSDAPISQARVIDFVNTQVGPALKKRIDEEVAYEEELEKIRASRPVIWGAPYGWWGPCNGWWGGRCGWWW